MTTSDLAVRPYGLGDDGPVVAEVRDRLVRIGLLLADTRAEGPFDDGVDRAVRLFQQQRGITVDGLVGPETYRRLEEARWSLGDRTLAYTAGHLVAGDDVAALQQRLAGMGFDIGKVDGRFGPGTDRALREFQRNVGIDVDGVCGPDTHRALARLSRTVSGGRFHVLRETLALDDVTTGASDKVVVLDPGHGGDDAGARFEGLCEAELAESIAAKVEGRLGAIGTSVLLTRGSHLEVEGSLDERIRAEFCNETGADLVVSLHVGVSRTAHAHGVATYYYGGDRFGSYSMLGERAAHLVHDEILARTDLTDCRVHEKTWDLLRLTRMPTIRVECGYVTNPGDAARLSDAVFLDTIADAVASAVVRYFSPTAG
jgi:N-acetylmuramoyl-L-alanine amidase